MSTAPVLSAAFRVRCCYITIGSLVVLTLFVPTDTDAVELLRLIAALTFFLHVQAFFVLRQVGPLDKALWCISFTLSICALYTTVGYLLNK